jgi:diguanylate cyclase (GGDEF)-like protein
VTDETDDWDDTVAALPGDLETDPGPSQAYLVVVRGNNVGTSYAVTGPTMVVGRAAGSDLRLNDDGVSRFHCKLHHHPNGIVVEDLGSRNGTYCNGERLLPGLRPLVEGDRLQIGTGSVLRFTYVEAAETSPVPLQSDSPDELTGAIGRRMFMDRLETEVEAALARKTPLSLVLVHIDRFAAIATTHGKAVLDQIAFEVANCIRENPRPDDVVARIGPGDFAVLSLWVSPGDTFMFAESVRKRVLQRAVTSAPVQVSLSLGIASIHELNVDGAHDLLLAAGSALQRARGAGGNRSVLCTPDLVREPKNRATV